MTEIIGQPQWSPVRLLDENELAMGGEDGNMNEQAQALVDRTEYLNQEKANKEDIVQGQFSFTTLAAFEAKKASIPINSTVIIDEAGPNQGTNTWTGVELKKSAYDPFTLLHNEVLANRFYKPYVINNSVDCNTLKTPGLHTFVSGTVWNNSTNRPNFDNQWGQIYVLPVSEVVVVHYAICPNSSALAMRLCQTNNTWTAWKYFSDDSAIAASITSLIKSAIKSYTRPIYSSKSKNILDPNNLLIGYEIHSTNGVIAEVNSVTTEYIDVRGATSIVISGLQDNTQIARLYRFLDKNENVVGAVSNIGQVNEKILPVPANAEWFQISIKQRNPNPLNIATAQIEYGIASTPYVDFNRGDLVGIHGTHIKQTELKLGYDALAKNMLNPSTLLMGAEIHGSGALLPEVRSVTTDLINVSGLQTITLSGLQPNPEIPRYYRFLDSNNVVLNKAQVPNPNTAHTIVIPENAKWFQLSLLQRTATVLDISKTQIEKGPNATAYEAYKAGVASINGIEIVKGISPEAITTLLTRAYRAKGMWLGDSRAQTSNVEAGDFTSTTFVPNYPAIVKSILKLSDFKNYARSGATFAHTTGAQLPWQKISTQILTAIANAENPDFIMLDAGTNDMNWNRSQEALVPPKNTLGTFETAMSKDIASLDMKITAEAMRWALFTIRQAFPNAVCFYATQTQRADTDPVYQEISNDIMVRLARRYGFTIIDGLYGFEIIKDFEVWKQIPTDPDAGRFLRDGLHMNPAGMQVMANFYSSQIIKRMTY